MDGFFTLYRKIVRVIASGALILCALYYIIAFLSSGGLSGALYRISVGNAQEPGAFSPYFQTTESPLPNENVTEEEPPLVL